MEIDLLENLHELSNTVKKIQLEKYSISQLIHIHNYYCIDDFKDSESYVFQNDVLNADDRKINFILKNFDKAIDTNCSNKIDLDQYSIDDRFEISYSTNDKVKAVSKLYTIKHQFPKDDDLFKCYWLKHFIKECKQIVENIRSIIEQPDEPINISASQMINNQFKYDDFKDLLLVEELEKRIAIEAVEYKTRIDELWQTYTFDPTYFDTFISGDLYNVFLNAIYERIKPLNDFEINKYLTLSVNQFKTHTPTKRAETFKRIYQATYWYPNKMEYKENEHDDKYAMHVWKHYTNHFHLFKEASENMLQDFKKGLIGNGRKQEVIEKPKAKAKSKHQSFTYINNLTGQTQLTDLMNALKRKKLIENSTDLKDFRKAFSGEAIDKPITWTGNISELSYFIKQLHNELKLVENLKQQQWAVTTNCFIQVNGKPFERSKFRGQKVPSTSKNIDSTLNTLK
ncbi:hypothetical protein [Croceibacter atlanticus]|uniref:hypothetical protein n=1 Tax=Croceibacter atlanticus TaxID=313588 RepID=UPI0030DA9E2F|tara:strand:- start:32060 stop:33424 length:1365 start_codon:yes stop_codon:yes gene_type:complete